MLNSNNATTFGYIPTKILKQSSKSCSFLLQKLFNDALRDGYFPNKLKCADVMPVLKRYYPTNARNYGPVSALSGVSNIFERLMHRQISFYIDQFLSPYICIHRKGFSTQHALLSIIKKRKKVLDNKKYSRAILMDLSKAFDTINHDFLIAKLHAYGFSKESLKLHAFFRSNTSFQLSLSVA